MNEIEMLNSLIPPEGERVLLLPGPTEEMYRLNQVATTGKKSIRKFQIGEETHEVEVDVTELKKIDEDLNLEQLARRHTREEDPRWVEYFQRQKEQKQQLEERDLPLRENLGLYLNEIVDVAKEYYQVNPYGAHQAKCSNCSGRGLIPNASKTCPLCKGKGKVTRAHELTLVDELSGEDIHLELSLEKLVASRIIKPEVIFNSYPSWLEISIRFDWSTAVEKVLKGWGLSLASSRPATPHWGTLEWERQIPSIPITQRFNVTQEGERALYSASTCPTRKVGFEDFKTLLLSPREVLDKALEENVLSWAFRHEESNLQKPQELEDRGLVIDEEGNILERVLKVRHLKSVKIMLSDLSTAAAMKKAKIGLSKTCIETGMWGPAVYLIDDEGQKVELLAEEYDWNTALSNATNRLLALI